MDAMCCQHGHLSHGTATGSPQRAGPVILCPHLKVCMGPGTQWHSILGLGINWTGLLVKENPKPEPTRDLRGLTERCLAAGVRLGLTRRQEHDRAAAS